MGIFTAVQEIASQEIVLFGESLGGAVAAWLAAQKNPGLAVAGFHFYFEG